MYKSINPTALNIDVKVDLLLQSFSRQVSYVKWIDLCFANFVRTVYMCVVIQNFASLWHCESHCKLSWVEKPHISNAALFLFLPILTPRNVTFCKAGSSHWVASNCPFKIQDQQWLPKHIKLLFCFNPSSVVRITWKESGGRPCLMLEA